jgi:hypothetical protein
VFRIGVGVILDDMTEHENLENEEGWFQDHLRIHEERWYSDGIPTSLVKDSGVESKDPPPSPDRPSEPLVRSVPHGESPGPDDLLRADDAENRGNANPDYSLRAFEVEGFTHPNQR